MSGYTILERKPSVSGGEIILAFLPDNQVTPYVTWKYYFSPITRQMVREHGHYFYQSEGMAAALKDYLKRA